MFWARLLIPVLSLAACTVGESGISPPLNRIFLPAAAHVDATSRFLFVVNSNSDLRFNSGTVAAVDLLAAQADRQTTWPVCPAGEQVPRTASGRLCCRDPLAPQAINCDERPYMRADQTVKIGSFGVDIVSQGFVSAGQARERLFVGVRSDPSVTWIDVAINGADLRMQCNGEPGNPATASPNAECEEPWKVIAGASNEDVREQVPDPELLLAEEPFALTLDEQLGLLYVGHLSSSVAGVSGGLPVSGVSLFDVCDPGSPRLPTLVSFNRTTFGPSSGSDTLGVASVTPSVPGDAAAPIYATARFSANIAELFLEGADSGPCASRSTDGALPRDVRLTPARSVLATAFLPRGADLRKLILDPDVDRAYVLHRNGSGLTATRNVIASTAAVAVMDTSLDAFGNRRFAPLKTVEVAGAPLDMVLHDSGRGKRLFVTCFDAGQIWVIDPAQMEVSAIVDVGRGAAGLDFPPADPSIAYVANFADNNISVVDLRPGSPTEFQVIQRIGFPRDAQTNVFP